MLHKVEWKDILGYEGLYQVSNEGSVRSIDRICFNGKVFHTKKGVDIKMQNNGHYYKVSLSKDGNVKQFLVHRLVALHFVENPFNKPEINHIDSNTYNNNIYNLEWVTPKENTAHRLKRYFKIKNSMVSLKHKEQQHE